VNSQGDFKGADVGLRNFLRGLMLAQILAKNGIKKCEIAGHDHQMIIVGHSHLNRQR